MDWGLVLQIVILASVASFLIAMIMSFHQSYQNQASENRRKEMDAKRLLQDSQMALIEAQMRSKNGQL